MVCPECGESFKSSAKVCPYDGSPLEEDRDGGEKHLREVIDGRFRIDALLGEGGMGRVYEATQLSVDRQVAVKLIRSETLYGDADQERFYREARVISDFSHPNIVRLIDFGEDDDLGVPYLVMEYIDGLVLTDLVDGQRLHPNLVLEVTSQVAAGLVEAHDADIVHRDLKTDNILLVPVSPGGFQAKIIDFGVAFPQQTDESLTSTGAVCGTPQYLSPQQARSEEVGPASDLYSLGVIMFEMTTGSMPFEGDSAFDIMVKHVQSSPPPISEFVESGKIPVELETLIESLLRKDPEERPDSARRVREAVETIRSAAGWSSMRLDDGADLEEALEPWTSPPSSRDEQIVTAEHTAQAGAETGPVRPDTDAGRDPVGRDTQSGAAEGRSAAPDEQRAEEREEVLARAPTAHEEPAPTEEVAPGESDAAPSASRAPAGERSGSRSSQQHASSVGGRTGTRASESGGTDTWVLIGVSAVLVAALGALVGAVYVLQQRPAGPSEGEGERAGAGADAGAATTSRKPGSEQDHSSGAEDDESAAAAAPESEPDEPSATGSAGSGGEASGRAAEESTAESSGTQGESAGAGGESDEPEPSATSQEEEERKSGHAEGSAGESDGAPAGGSERPEGASGGSRDRGRTESAEESSSGTSSAESSAGGGEDEEVDDEYEEAAESVDEETIW